MANPKEAAEEFRARHDLGHAPIKDVAQIIEEYHRAWVMQMELPEGLDARTTHNPARGHTLVCVATIDSPERQRFTLAHELAHLEAGTLSTEVHNSPDANDRPEERWANEFARHFLLPIDGLRQFLKDVDPDVDWTGPKVLSDIVRAYGVSPTVAQMQLRGSGLVPADAMRALTRTRTPWTTPVLARRFGWAAEREQAVLAAKAVRRPTALVEAATSGYLAGTRSLEELAHVSGERDLQAFHAALIEADLIPEQDRVADEPTWEAEDFTDLLGDDQ